MPIYIRKQEMFNTNKVGRPIAVVKGGEDDGEKIYLDVDSVGQGGKIKRKNFPHMKIDDGVFQQLPDTSRERDCIIIAGQSGSGKSWWANAYAKEYKKAYPRRPIYFCSVLDEDSSIDKKVVQRINIDESWIDEPLTIEDVKECLVIMDDVEMIKEKPIREALFTFINSILTTGRHTKTSIILTTHYPNHQHIRNFLNEAHNFVYFPYGSNRATNYVLENYIGLGKKDIMAIKKLKTRWCSVFKSFPQCVLTEHNIFTVADMND